LYNLLCPHLILNTLQDLEHHKLRQLGIKGIIFDLDNTIIPWDSQEMSPEIIEFLKALLTAGFKICLLSNNMDRRVKSIAAIFGIPFISRAYKPAKTGFHHAVTAMELPRDQVAVVGDQLFTDILGGNRIGLVTIWVRPLCTQEFIGTKITRRLEKLAVRILKAKGLMK
jgi:HAD superfamily phosphatase (TIGR01668 family)